MKGKLHASPNHKLHMSSSQAFKSYIMCQWLKTKLHDFTFCFFILLVLAFPHLDSSNLINWSWFLDIYRKDEKGNELGLNGKSKEVNYEVGTVGQLLKDIAEMWNLWLPLLQTSARCMNFLCAIAQNSRLPFAEVCWKVGRASKCWHHTFSCIDIWYHKKYVIFDCHCSKPLQEIWTFSSAIAHKLYASFCWTMWKSWKSH